MGKTPSGSKKIQTQAMLVRLKMGSYRGAIIDREATDDLTQLKHASEKSARVWKQLISKDYLADIITLTSSIRQTYMRLTMPWDDSGVRLLPLKQLARFRSRMDKLFEKRLEAIGKFVEKYDEAVEQAKIQLGDLFDENDYKGVDFVKSRFSQQYELLPIPDASHFIVDVSEQDAKAIREQIQKSVESRITGAVTDLYRRLGEAVKSLSNGLDRMANKKEGERKTFHRSLLENLRDLADEIPQLNLTGDEGLAHLCEQVKTSINGVEANMLRPSRKDFDEARTKKVADDMSKLSEQFAGYFGSPQEVSQVN